MLFADYSSSCLCYEADQLPKLLCLLAWLEQEELQARLVVAPLEPKLIAVAGRVAFDVALQQTLMIREQQAVDS